MNFLLRKTRTLAGLIFGGRFSLLRDRAVIAVRRLRFRWQGGAPFVFRRGGVRCVCHPDWPQSREHFCSAGEPDDLEMALLPACLRTGDGFVDVGTNLGLYSFVALRAVGDAGGVVAVDADADACRRLELALRVLGATSAQVVHAAVTDQAGEVTFHVSENRVRSDIQSLKPGADARSKGLRPVVVPAITLADLAREKLGGRVPRMIKLDIEGAEVAALEACPPEWLAEDGPLWIVEINPACLAEFGRAPVDVVRFFAGAFDCVLVPKFPAPGVSPRPRLVGPDSGFGGALFHNLVAVPRGASWWSDRARILGLLGVA